MGANRQRLADPVGQFAQIERRPLELDPARLDLGQVENVVDQIEQRVAVVDHDVQVLALLGVEPGLREQFRHPEHGVHRGADFVGHAGEKLGLGARRRQRRLARLDQLALGCLERRDIARDRKTTHVSAQLEQRRRKQAWHFCAVLVPESDLHVPDFAALSQLLDEASIVVGVDVGVVVARSLADHLVAAVAGAFDVLFIDVDEFAGVKVDDRHAIEVDVEQLAEGFLALLEPALGLFQFRDAACDPDHVSFACDFDQFRRQQARDELSLLGAEIGLQVLEAAVTEQLAHGPIARLRVDPHRQFAELTADQLFARETKLLLKPAVEIDEAGDRAGGQGAVFGAAARRSAEMVRLPPSRCGAPRSRRRWRRKSFAARFRWGSDARRGRDAPAEVWRPRFPDPPSSAARTRFAPAARRAVRTTPGCGPPRFRDRVPPGLPWTSPSPPQRSFG